MQLEEQKSLFARESSSSKNKNTAIIALAVLSVVLTVICGFLAKGNLAIM